MADMMSDMGGMSGVPGMSGMSGMSGTSGTSGVSGTDHGQHGAMHDSVTSSLKVLSKKARHARTGYDPGTGMHVDMARTNLDDLGIGLRNNGRRVLVLQDMHTIGSPMDSRGSQHEVELRLTGNMERYTRSSDGIEFGKSTPAHFRYGERLRVTLHNNTMMTHPMHMRGMRSEPEAPDGTFLARGHTIPA